MYNDRLQGILFDQSEKLDLINRKRRDRFMRKVVTVRQERRYRRRQPVQHQDGQFIIPKKLSKKKYDAAISDLYSRFKQD
ncbi:MAG TPA: hypothetical protein VM535_00295 [Candidatus Saccharimonadales bacterium]|nr:hypothetical protein [Candidatus Saccharimonadales bacterium]